MKTAARVPLNSSREEEDEDGWKTTKQRHGKVSEEGSKSLNVEHVRNREEFYHDRRNPNSSYKDAKKVTTSIFITNFPPSIATKDLWNRCDEWGTVVDIFISKRLSNVGKRFGFIRFIKIDCVEKLIRNLRTIWFGNHHLFADNVRSESSQRVSTGGKFGDVSNGVVISNNNVPGKNQNIPSFVDVLKWGSKWIAKSTPVHTKRKVILSDEDGLDIDKVTSSMLAQVRDVKSIHNLFLILSDNGFEDFAIRYVGGRWVWIEFANVDVAVCFKESVEMKQLFVDIKDVTGEFMPEERLIWVDVVGAPLAAWTPKAFTKLGSVWGECIFVDMDVDESIAHGKVSILKKQMSRIQDVIEVVHKDKSYDVQVTEVAYWAPKFVLKRQEDSKDSSSDIDADKSSVDSINEVDAVEVGFENVEKEIDANVGNTENIEHLDVDNCDSDLSKDDNKVPDASSAMSSTSRLMREVDVPGVDSEGEIIGESVLNDNGCVKDCMENKLDDGVEKDIEDCSNNVPKKCGVINNNMSNNVEGEILQDHFDGDRGNDAIEENVDVNPSTNISLDVNQNTSTPEVAGDLPSLDRSNAKAERFEKRWSYRDPDGNVQGPFSLTQLHMWKDCFPSDVKIWNYYGNVKETFLLHSALKRRTKDVG